MAADDLDRYIGIYHAGAFVRQRALIPVRLNVIRDGARLAIRRNDGSVDPLTATGTHTFADESRTRGFHFEIGPSGRAESVTTTKGPDAASGPLLVPLPEASDDPRVFEKTLELGHITLCMPTADVEVSAAFYRKLGFSRRDDDGDYLFHQGFVTIAFMDWLKEPCINFRGPSVLATGSALSRRGFEILGIDYQANRVARRELPIDEGGMFSLTDPDGHHLFFNTHAGEERDAYEAWRRGAPGTNPQERPDESTPAEMDLGRLVVCLDVTDLERSVAFYRRLGFRVIAQARDATTLWADPARPNPRTFAIRLQRAGKPAFAFGFVLPAAALRILSERVPTRRTDGRSEFTDPDGHRITLLTSD